MTKPNSDLGVNAGDDAYLNAQYPLIADFLIWPELRVEFSAHEATAMKMKIGSRRRSGAAILLITLSSAVSYLATSSVLEQQLMLHSSLGPWLAAVATLCMIAALLFGKGILWGRKRDVWLTERLLAERIRQFFFQFLLANLSSVCSQSFSDRRHCLEQRSLVLEKVLRRLRTPAYRQTVKDDSSLQEGLMLEIPETISSQIDEARYSELILFWEELRFDWQTKYSTSTLDRKASPLPLSGSLADQEHSLSVLESSATLGVVACQLVAIVGLFFYADTQLASFAVLASSLLAIGIVGLQAYKEGMGLTNDLLRNRAYATYSAKLTREFKAAGVLSDRRSEIHAMKEMETLAYFETREFINAHSRSHFSL